MSFPNLLMKRFERKEKKAKKVKHGVRELGAKVKDTVQLPP